MAPIDGAPYTGPMPEEMMRTHTLATNIISRHDDACPIFDAPEYVLLRRFVMDPSQRDAILQDCDMVDPSGSKVGEGAMKHGSLAGYIVARHIDRERGPALLDDEIEQLRNWFQSGACDERTAGARETGRT